MSVESPSPEDRFRLRPRSRGSGLAYAALWLLLVAAIAIALVQLRGGRQTEAQRLYAEGRTAFAPDSIEVLGTLDRAMRETSGLAVSVEHAGIVWSHNDSGDEARIYALDLTGLVVARFELEGVEARDWEAMDRGPCVLNPGAECLYVADTGDNVRRRDVLEIHLVPEPDPRSGRTSVVAEGSLRYLYPEGPRDAEAVAVAPDGAVVIVTKGRAEEIRLFAIEPEMVRRAVTADTPIRLDAGTRLPIEPNWDVGRVVTGAAFRADGAVLAVRTLSEIYFFGWPELDEAAPPCFLGRREPQGEAIAWEPSGAILLSSESTLRGPGELLRVRCGGV